MYKLIGVVGLVSLVTVVALGAEEPVMKGPDFHEPVTKAMAAYQQGGADKFAVELLKTRSFVADRRLIELGNAVREAETQFGHFQDYEFIYEKQVSKRVMVVWYEVNYEKGPAFGSVTVYDTDKEMVVLDWDFHLSLRRALTAMGPISSISFSRK